MNLSYKSFDTNTILFLLACTVCMGLTLVNLGGSALWYDEAQTAFIAKGVLETGWPVPHDGRQFIPDGNVFHNEDQLWVEHPWLQFYITALGFKIFGINPVSARLPYVLIGFCTVFLLYKTVIRLYGKGTAQLACVLLLLSVPYILHIRQCRYYAVLCFATVWMFWAYMNFEREERRAILHIIGAAVLMYYSNIASFFALMAGVTLWIVLKGKYAGRLRDLCITYGAIFLLTFPWFIYADLTTRRGQYGGWDIFPTISRLGAFILEINAYIIPLAFLSVLSVILLKHRLKRHEMIAYLLIPVALVGHTIITGLPSPPSFILAFSAVFLFALTAFWIYRMAHSLEFLQPAGPLLATLILGGIIGLTVVVPLTNFRYILGFIPLLCIPLALLLKMVWERSKTVGGIAGGVLLGTNIFHAVPVMLIFWLPVSAQHLEQVIRATVPAGVMERITGRSEDEIQAKLGDYLTRVDGIIASNARLKTPYTDYLYEITQPRRGPVEGVLAYLKEHGQAGDTIFSDSDMMAYVFHTGMIAKPASILEESLDADWISLRPHSFYENHTAWRIRHFYDEVIMPYYDKIELTYPDLPNLDYNQPSPRYHEFRLDSEDYPRMFIFRRKK